MRHYWRNVPALIDGAHPGNVALSRHAQQQAERAGISEDMVHDALYTPDKKDLPDSQGVVFRERGVIRLVVVLRPEPFRGASLVTTIIRKQPQASAKNR